MLLCSLVMEPIDGTKGPAGGGVMFFASGVVDFAAVVAERSIVSVCRDSFPRRLRPDGGGYLRCQCC